MHDAHRSGALEHLGHVYQWLLTGDSEADLVRYHLQQAERVLQGKEINYAAPSNPCPHTFKSVACGYVGSANYCSKTFARCRQLNNAANYGGNPGIEDLRLAEGLDEAGHRSGRAPSSNPDPDTPLRGMGEDTENGTFHNHQTTDRGDIGRRVEALTQWATTMAEVMDSVLSQAQRDAIRGGDTGEMSQTTHWRLTLEKAQRFLSSHPPSEPMASKPLFSGLVTTLRTQRDDFVHYLPRGLLNEAANALEELWKNYEKVFSALWHLAKGSRPCFTPDLSYEKGRARLELRQHSGHIEVVVLENTPDE